MSVGHHPLGGVAVCVHTTSTHLFEASHSTHNYCISRIPPSSYIDLYYPNHWIISLSLYWSALIYYHNHWRIPPTHIDYLGILQELFKNPTHPYWLPWYIAATIEQSHPAFINLYYYNHWRLTPSPFGSTHTNNCNHWRIPPNPYMTYINWDNIFVIDKFHKIWICTLYILSIFSWHHHSDMIVLSKVKWLFSSVIYVCRYTAHSYFV